MGLDARISRLEQRLGLAPDADLVIFVYYDTPDGGPGGPDDTPAYTIRWTARGERITTYYDPDAGDGPGCGPGTKVYHGVDPERV